MINGDIYGQYNSDKYSDDTAGSTSKTNYTYSFVFEPQIKYFIIDNLSIGLTPQYGISNRTYQSSDHFKKTMNYGGEISIGKYFGSDELMPFIALSGGIGKNDTKYTGYIFDENGMSYKTTINDSNWYKELAAQIGVAYFVNEKVSINLLLKYIYNFTDYQFDSRQTVDEFELTNSKINSLYLGTGISILL